MNYIILTYSLYLVLNVALTIWVAKTLSKNGRVFLVDCFHQNEPLADSVNHLLVVGFYLINLGFIAQFLTLKTNVIDPREVFEALSGKMGVVLLVLGVMHFFNLLVLTKVRRRAIDAQLPPPLPARGQ
ncbi:MAG: hypothetical protein ABI443_01295 [Chthoniobacterales bacterium]